MNINWINKLQNLLQTAAFCLAVATIQFAFMPNSAYMPSVMYSLAIGLSIWAMIDLGRHLFPSAIETGWPQGMTGLLLPVAAIVAGFFTGSYLGDLICRTFSLYTGPPVDRAAEFRISFLITLIAGVVGSYYFYSINKSHYLQRKMGEARKHADEARLKLLETQLEPHMLFNTLANLRALIGVDPQRAQEMLDHMIAYLRATLDASRATTHPLQAEFDRLRDYLELMAIRMGPRLGYEMALPKALAQTRVPALLLQPLVENSIKHGLEPKVGGGQIMICACTSGDLLVLEVADTGAGEGQGASTAGAGFGLTQVRERLAALYGERASLEFRTDGDGAHARITLPLA
ncbi:hypothetical protein GCM10027034_22680 [Ramlibacter solisilvae]|uniref:histidine kinase n=1 Tax=Ramlibacter tataouinensis TaxID=94132 RepID=A0A127JQ21_9BURK|nr:histidine kinase [Ramlibacter tataouinensis]AMO21993.1 histidine kinase [Ramlibacter tataouinensis]